MGIISDESIKRVLEATDIVDLINAYIPLKRAGAAWKGMCPFHNDNHPSMTVNPARQIFMCFACQTGGDAFSFVMKYENIGFVDAVRKLADRAGIVLIEEESNPGQDRQRRLGKSLTEINKMAADYFHSLLKEAPAAQHARDYLKNRGYEPEMSVRWNVGWSPDESSEFLRWARSRKIPDDLLVESGLANRDERGRLYARFRDRLMFPINNDRGDCVGFSGRLLREMPNVGKYINTPETPIFKKSQLCFGLDKAQKGIRDSKQVLICEGQVDVIACHEAGIDYTVASLGTAFTPEHAKLLKRRTDKAIICFDGDTAGIKAADKAFVALAAEGVEVSMVRMPTFENGKGDDPDSFIKREGGDAFRQLLDQAMPFIPSRIEHGRASGLLKDATSSARFAREIADLIAAMNDQIARDLAASEAATRLQTGIDILRSSVHESVRQNKKRPAVRSYEEAPSPTSPRREPEARPVLIDRAVLILCQLALQDPKTQELIIERIEDLVDAMESLPGGNLLKAILEKGPNPEDPAEIHTFIRSLPAEQAKAVHLMHIDPVKIKEPEKVVGEACTGLVNTALEKQLNETLARLKDHNLPVETRLELMKKSVDMKKLLNSITPRTP